MEKKEKKGPRKWHAQRLSDRVTEEGFRTYWDIETKKHVKLSLDEINKIGTELPVECQAILDDVKKTKRSITRTEQSKLLQLCSMSLSIWKGNPQGKLEYTSMEEYKNEFYIQMVKFLTAEGKSKWNPERSRWAAYVKWIRLSTVDAIIKKGQEMKFVQTFSNNLDADGIPFDQDIWGSNMDENIFRWSLEYCSTNFNPATKTMKKPKTAIEKIVNNALHKLRSLGKLSLMK